MLMTKVIESFHKKTVEIGANESSCIYFNIHGSTVWFHFDESNEFDSEMTVSHGFSSSSDLIQSIESAIDRAVSDASEKKLGNFRG